MLRTIGPARTRRSTAALATHGGGFAHAYGNGDLDKAVERSFNEIFEREVAVFFVGTGTAANSLCADAGQQAGRRRLLPPRSACRSKTSAARRNIFTGGTRLCPVDGALGRIDPASLEAAIARYPAEVLHSGRPMAVSITQSTEIGTVYGLDEIAAISAICRKAGLPLHMDGARFANALVSLDTTPAEMTWKRGVDTLSFGGTKNGCWCAEAIVLFDLAKARRDGLHPQARGAALFQVALHRGAVRRLFRRRAVAGIGAPRQFAGRPAGRPHPRVEENPPRLGAAGQRGFCGDDVRREEPPAEARARCSSTGTRRISIATSSPPARGICRFVTSFATTADEVDAFGELIA